MAAAAFQLTVVFSIIPVIPMGIFLASRLCGDVCAVATGLIWYILYPLFFGFLMWVTVARMEVPGHG